MFLEVMNNNGDFMSPHRFLQGLRINAADYIEVLQKGVFLDRECERKNAQHLPTLCDKDKTTEE